MSNLKGLKERCDDLYEEDYGDYTIVNLDKEVLEACFWLIERYEKALKEIAESKEDTSCNEVALKYEVIAEKALEG